MMMPDLLSLPAFFLFHIVWLIHSIRRPLLLVSALCVLSDPAAAMRKLRLVCTSVAYLLFCKDKKWKVPDDPDPASFFPPELGGSLDPSSSSSSSGGGGWAYREKTVILIRHGESTWNDSFNPGQRNRLKFALLFVPNLMYAILAELYYFVSGRDRDSWFYDSPLSSPGKAQIEGLRSFLKKEGLRLGAGGGGGVGKGKGGACSREDRAIQILLALGGDEGGDAPPPSHVVSSSLRRAISTAAIGLADRFSRTCVVAGGCGGGEDDRVILLPSLQEISINPDALSILPPRGEALPTWCDGDIPGLPPDALPSLVDSRHHGGNKALTSNGLERLGMFASDVFDVDRLPRPNVVAVGHSLFFRSFFRLYMPRGAGHVAKEKKLVNGGAVMVTLREASSSREGGGGKKVYMIDPGSIVVIYGGFGKHTKG
jgi:broad specificity phosphatase PhoE